MSILGNHKPAPSPVDLDRLADEIRHTTKPPAIAYAPPEVRQTQKPSYTPLQVIGHAITRLTWMDAEAMGDAVKDQQKEGITLTAAIQNWAAKWEQWSDD